MEPRGAERFFETTEIGSTLKRKALGELVCVWGAGLVSECREGFWVDTGVFFHYWEELGDQIPGSSGPGFFFLIVGVQDSETGLFLSWSWLWFVGVGNLAG